MNVKDPKLRKWVADNRETLLGQLVLYHSPVNLAEMVLDDEKIDDDAVRRIKSRLERSEGLLKKEKSIRKKSSEVKTEPKTERERDDEAKAEKAKSTEKACAEKAKGKFDDVFVDDDYDYHGDDQDSVFDQF